MPLELLWLLLPVAAASGWMVARRAAAGAPPAPSAIDLSPHYFEGLNYLLNEQPDKAIEVFVRMVEVDSETVETHLALGSLFRQRGEVERAIRIHQNLIARTTLSLEQRALAMLELGQDYMSAGLLDRAEALFKELVELDLHSLRALELLNAVYETEKEWEDAILTARQIEAKTGSRRHGVIAHYFCEMATEARDACDYDAARRYIRNALSIDGQCVRASILEGHIEKDSGNCAAALQAFARVEQQDPGYFDEVVGAMHECFSGIGKPERVFERLRETQERSGGLKTTLLLADMIRARQGNREAVAFLEAYLLRQPSLTAMSRYIELQRSAAPAASPGGLDTIAAVIARALEKTSRYKCSHCGFSGRKMHWQCPSCKIWSGVRPLQGMEI